LNSQRLGVSAVNLSSAGAESAEKTFLNSLRLGVSAVNLSSAGAESAEKTFLNSLRLGVSAVNLSSGRCQEFCVNGFRLVDDFRLHWLHLSGG
jgi:hypothetical protein